MAVDAATKQYNEITSHFILSNFNYYYYYFFLIV